MGQAQANTPTNTLTKHAAVILGLPTMDAEEAKRLEDAELDAEDTEHLEDAELDAEDAERLEGAD